MIFLTFCRRFALLIVAATFCGANAVGQHLHYINTNFENASPLWWEELTPGEVDVYLNYDHERDSPNRAAGHWHFQVQAEPGTELTFTLHNLSNVWNGRPGFPLSDRTLCNVSEDGRTWRHVETEVLADYQQRFTITMREDTLFVAHLEPYRISDLNRLLDEIRDHTRVHIEEIGKTVQGRPLEIIRIGNHDAPHRVFLRARAHPWEPGGNWVVQGLIKSLLSDDPRNEEYLKRYAVHIMPMANKDGVAKGWTRFNQLGKDLNRNWDKPADAKLAPENAALENWFQRMTDAGRRPDLAIDLHNDQSGRLHVSRPEIDLENYLKNIERYELLMREHTWFTEGKTGGSFRNPGSIGEGLLERFGITAFVQELNANWVEGLKQPSSGKNWELLGNQYREVFFYYFAEETTF